MFFLAKNQVLLAFVLMGAGVRLHAQPHHADTLHKTLHPVIITEERSIVSEIYTARPLTAKQIMQTRGESLGNMLLMMNGVSALQNGVGISKPVIGGLHSNRILILNNGIRQEGQQWGSDHAPEIDPFVAQNITVIKGAGTVRYGCDALGGVVLVQPHDLPTAPKTTGEINTVGSTNGRAGAVSATVQGVVGKAQTHAYRLQGTLRRSGNAHTPQYFLKNTGIAERNFSIDWDWHKATKGAEVFYSNFNTDIGIFGGAHIGNLTDLQQVLNGTKPPDKTQKFAYTIARPRQAVHHNLLKIKYHYITKNNAYCENTIAYQHNQRQEYDKHRPRNDSVAALNLAEFDYTLRTFTHDFFYQKQLKNTQLQIGTNTIAQANVYAGKYFIPNFLRLGTGVFGIIHRDFINGVALEIGARYDAYRQQIYRRNADGSIYSPVFNTKNWAGNIGGVWHINNNWCWRGNVGSSWRPPSVNEQFSDGLHHGAAAIEKGTENLQPERAVSMITELNFLHNNKWQGEVAMYQNYIRNYIYLLPQALPVLTIRGAFPAFIYTQTDAVFRGIDATVSYKIINNTTATAKCAIINARNTQNDQPLIWIPTNTATLGIEQKLTDTRRCQQPYITAQWQYVARSNATTIADYALPPPAYYLLNAQAGTVFLLKNQNIINITISAQNILNATYRNYMNRLRYFSDDLGRNISIKIKFQF